MHQFPQRNKRLGYECINIFIDVLLLTFVVEYVYIKKIDSVDKDELNNICV